MEKGNQPLDLLRGTPEINKNKNEHISNFRQSRYPLIKQLNKVKMVAVRGK